MNVLLKLIHMSILNQTAVYFVFPGKNNKENKTIYRIMADVSHLCLVHVVLIALLGHVTFACMCPPATEETLFCNGDYGKY